MFKSTIVWRMARRNLSAQKRQTWLTLLGGGIGIMLAVAAVVFWAAFDESGLRWVKTHFGIIDWELKPTERDGIFTPQQVDKLRQRMEDEYDIAPAVTLETAAFHESQQKAVPNVLVVGIDPDSLFLAEEVRRHIAGDRIAISRPTAELLQLEVGDVVGIHDHEQQMQLFKVAAVVEEQGITGYRGMKKAAGTILTDLAAARKLTGVADDSFNTIFVSNSPAVTLETPQFPVYFSDISYTVLEPKREAISKVNRIKYSYGVTFLIASGFAVVSGLILMRELLNMLADQRKERFGALRALGFSRGQIRRIFLAEALLLNAGSVLIGTLAGSALGYGILRLFLNRFTDTLQRYAALDIPILPYISVPHAAIAATCLFAVNSSVIFAAAFSVSRLSITNLLRGHDGSAGPASRVTRIRSRLLTAGSLAVLLCFVYLLVSGEAVQRLQKIGMNFPVESLVVFALWLASPFSFLYLVIRAFGYAGIWKRALLPSLPVLLAVRYPLRNVRRMFSVSALFAIVFLMTSMVMTAGHQSVADKQRAARSYDLLGYPAFIPYADESEKEKLIQQLEKNESLREAIRFWHPLDTYRLSLNAPGVLKETISASIVTPDRDWIRNSEMTLAARMPGFSSDEEVWEALEHRPDAVVLHEMFMYAASDWPDNLWAHRILPDQPIRPGDKITIEVMPERKSSDTKPIERKELTVLGFVRTEHHIEFFHLIMVSPSFYDEFRDHGFQWPNTPHLGYVMIRPNGSDLQQLLNIEEQFLLNGIYGFRAPGMEMQAEGVMLEHTLSIYTAFMILSAVIGIAGLAIVQMRAVHERANQLGMLRCIGVGQKSIALSFLMEGSLIGWSGLLVGLSFGSIGGFLIYQFQNVTRSPLEAAVPYSYPAAQLIGLLLAVMLVTLLLNLAPALRSFRLSPAEAVRSLD
jgi:ABC-type lipoprotein release transport system permease subunit